MARIWSMMDVGKRSLANSQTSLQTVAHNIANKGTEGYSRQRVDVVSNEPVGEGKLRIGMGAKAAAVTRINNPYLEKQLEHEGSESRLRARPSRPDGRASKQVYNEQTDEGPQPIHGRVLQFVPRTLEQSGKSRDTHDGQRVGRISRQEFPTRHATVGRDSGRRRLPHLRES